MTSEKRLQKFHTDDASLASSGSSRVISIEFLRSFPRRQFAGKPVVASHNVDCFPQQIKGKRVFLITYPTKRRDSVGKCLLWDGTPYFFFDKRSLKKWSWMSYCWFSTDVTAAIFVEKNKRVSILPMGKRPFFQANFAKKNCIVLSINMAALSCGCKPRMTTVLLLHSPGRWMIYFVTVILLNRETDTKINAK